MSTGIRYSSLMREGNGLLGQTAIYLEAASASATSSPGSRNSSRK